MLIQQIAKNTFIQLVFNTITMIDHIDNIQTTGCGHTSFRINIELE